MLVTPEIQQTFNQSKRIVFMTGAGVSTASGIPDYRSKNGIYNGISLRPEYLLSATAFAREPEKQYQFMIDNMYFPHAQPNIIHQKMAIFAQQGRARIVTQNVDDLHVQANTPQQHLVRFHGSLYDVYAPKDQKRTPWQNYMQSMYRQDGALLRPAITFYEEVPFDVEQSVRWVSEADLIVVVGTSFQVYPFAGLLQYAQKGRPIIAINLEYIHTPFPVQQVIGDAVEFFEEIHV